MITLSKGQRRQWHPTPVLFPRKSHGRRSVVGFWGRYQSGMTERLHFHYSLSCIGEGNGNLLQCSCLKNPGTGDLCGLPSMGSHRVRHDWSNLAAAAAGFYIIHIWLTQKIITYLPIASKDSFSCGPFHVQYLSLLYKMQKTQIKNIPK